MAYATLTELAAYLGVAEADLPGDAQRLLDRAALVFDAATLERSKRAVKYSDTAALDALRRATFHQYDYWRELGPETSVTGLDGGIDGSGKLTLTSARMLAPLAKLELLTAGLLYRGW